LQFKLLAEKRVGWPEKNQGRKSEGLRRGWRMGGWKNGKQITETFRLFLVDRLIRNWHSLNDAKHL
jgi:hypothetical protein